MRSTSRDRHGAQALEMALLLPVLLAATTGVIDYGIYFSRYMDVQSVNRAVARQILGQEMVTSGATEAACESAARDAIDQAGLLRPADPDCAVVRDTTSGQNFIEISVQVGNPPAFGFVPMPAQIAMVTTHRMEDEFIP